MKNKSLLILTLILCMANAKGANVMENESVVYKKLSDYKCEKYNGSNKTSLDIKLSSAVNFGKIDEVGELLACGANPKKEDASYGTILHKAAAQKSLNVVMLLAQAGANLNAVDKNGKTPVEVAKDQKIKEYLENAAKAKKEEENNRKAFEWYPSGSAPSLYPTELFFGDFIFSNGARLYIPKSIPFAADWGQSSGAMHILEDNE
ncbi:MAG: ankyrin repeat domain-containing protein, partial [Elusimicrobiota bacterium]|nr:ankyrin repeat domain-containing protein [Elusimicrobiota bacterium]